MKRIKEKKGMGKCDYCENEAEAMVRTKKLCRIHWWQFRKGGLFIPLKHNV